MGMMSPLEEPEKFHGASPYEISTGESKGSNSSAPKYQDVFGQQLVKHAIKNPKIVGITGAMPSGTGLNLLRDQLPGSTLTLALRKSMPCSLLLVWLQKDTNLSVPSTPPSSKGRSTL